MGRWTGRPLCPKLSASSISILQNLSVNIGNEYTSSVSHCAHKRKEGGAEGGPDQGIVGGGGGQGVG